MPVKKLHVAACIRDLESLASIQHHLNKSTNLLVTAADRIFRKAEEEYLDNDEETAYVQYMRYIEIILVLKKRQDFTKHELQYSLYQVRCVHALQRAKILKRSLAARYSVLERTTTERDSLCAVPKVPDTVANISKAPSGKSQVGEMAAEQRAGPSGRSIFESALAELSGEELLAEGGSRKRANSPTGEMETQERRTKRPTKQPSPLAAEELARDLKALLASGDGSDAMVRVEGREFRVHKTILGARTPVFSAMFGHDMSESSSGFVDIEDCEPDTFRRFLHFVYAGWVEDLTPENATRLYGVADKYKLEGLKRECLECIRGGLSVESFCPTMVLALKHDEKELARLANDFFAANIKSIIPTVEWQSFLSENPISANELLIRALGAAK